MPGWNDQNVYQYYGLGPHAVALPNGQVVPAPPPTGPGMPAAPPQGLANASAGFGAPRGPVQVPTRPRAMDDAEAARLSAMAEQMKREKLASFAAPVSLAPEVARIPPDLYGSPHPKPMAASYDAPPPDEDDKTAWM